jgi:aminopeptidase
MELTNMSNPRVEAYARLLVERCIDVQPGWQVMVESTPLARPLVEEVVRLIARREAYALVRLHFATTDFLNQLPWVEEAPEALLAQLAPIEREAYEKIDAWIHIAAPENTRAGADVDAIRYAHIRQALLPFTQRRLSLKIPWVGCRFPTPAMAQDAGMTLRAFEDFLYGACLLDWDEEGRKMRRIADRFDRAEEVRIVGEGTDLTLSLAGRRGMVDDGHLNMPGGEVFYSPVEDSAEGVVTFSEFPAVYGSHEVEGVRLVFRKGKVVEASARHGEEFLIKTLDTDPGARVLGEFGIGCNPGIQRHMKSTLFDEKIYGTIHLAVGAGFPFIGGTNESNVHWDMVKDLRQGGKIYCDGELVQENGAWVF